MANAMAMSGLHLAPLTTRVTKGFSPTLSHKSGGRIEECALKQPMVVCKKNHHRSPCNDRMCGLRGRDVMLLHELEEELQGQFSRLPMTAFPDSSEPGSPRGSQGGRSVFVSTKRNDEDSLNSQSYSQQAAPLANGSHASLNQDSPKVNIENDTFAASQNSSNVLNASNASTVQATEQPSRSKNQEPQVNNLRNRQEIASSWQDSLRGHMFWFFRTLSTVID